MAFTFSQPLKLLGIGGSLITTTSLWFFSPHASIQAQTRSSDKGTSSAYVVGEHDNLNLFTSVKKLESRAGTPKKDASFKVKSREANTLKFTLDDNGPEKTLSFSTFPNLDHLKVDIVLGNKSFYTDFPKESINISLFKKSVWYSDSEDEYEAIESQKINELFDGLDETKTKQLLLSLEKRIDWKKNGDNNYYPQIHYQQHTYNLDDLKSLKIKYFTDFEELKKYIKEKVTSCTNPREACVAHLDELDLMETDKLDFFQSSN